MMAIEALNSWSAVWATFMSRALVDVSGLLVVLLVVWLPLRRRMSAQVGYGLFCLVLVKLFVPVPGAWLPKGSVERAIEWAASSSHPEPAAVPPRWMLPATGDVNPSGAAVSPASPVTVGSAPAVEAGTALPRTRPSLSFASYVMVGWALCSFVLCARFLRGLGSTRRLLNDAIPLGRAWLPVDTETLERAAGVRRRVRWAVSPRLTSPAVGGLLKPTVVVPPDIDDGLTPKQLTWVLLHELAHVRRGDLWVVMGQRIAHALFFFHPAVHVANGIIDQLREYACDDAALAACQTSRSDCGEGFLTIVGRTVDRTPSATPALRLFESRTLVRRRLLRILDHERPVCGRLSGRGVAGLLIVALLVLPFGSRSLVWGRFNAAIAPNDIRALGDDLGESGNFGPSKVWLRGDGAFTKTRVAIPALAYSPDGALLAVAGEDGLVLVRDAKTGRVLHRLAETSDTVSCVAFSPDGRTLATGGFDRLVRLWDIPSGRVRTRLAGHTNWVFALAFSPDGVLLASGGHDKTVRLWDVRDGGPQRAPFVHEASVRALAFAPDGRTLAAGGAGRQIALWSVRDGVSGGRLPGHGATVRALAYSRDGATLASASEDGAVKLWDVASGRETAALMGHSDMVVSLAFSPGGGLLATGSLDATVKLWDARTGLERSSLAGHTDGVSALAFAPVGRQLATGGFDGSVRLWEPAAVVFSATVSLPCADELASVAFGPASRSLLAAGRGGVACWSLPSGAATRVARDEGAVLAVSNKRTVYATGDPAGRLRLFDSEGGRPFREWDAHTGAVTSVAFAPDDRWLVSGGADGSVRFWDVTERRLLRAIPRLAGPIVSLRVTPTGRTLAITWGRSAARSALLWDVYADREAGALRDVDAVAFSPDGKTLATAGSEGTVVLRDSRSLAPKATVAHARCRSLAFSPDGRLLGSAHENGDVVLWDAHSGEQRGQLKGHEGPVADLAFGNDGRSVATAGSDNTVKLWNLASQRQTPRVTLKANQDATWTVAYSPDAKTLAVADGPMDEPGAVTLWDVAERRVKATLEGHERGVATAVFAPDGKTLASGSWDGTIRLWDVAGGQTRYELAGLNGVTALAFSPNGKQLASVGEGRLLTLWDAETGAEVARLTEFRSDVQCLAFSPDGRRLATGGGAFGSRPQAGGEVRIWNVANRSLASELKGHDRAVVSLAFSPDGRSLATGGADQSVRVWDVPSGEARLTLTGLTDCVQAVAFSPDGRTLMWTGRRDGLVNLHDARTGAEVVRFVGHRAVVRGIAFSPDGSGLATAGADGTIRLWDMPSLP